MGSTNLFIWFKAPWFPLQLALMATTFLSREFLRWRRDGQDRHIFNPSGFGLALTSVALLATGSTGLTYGPEIATTLARPHYIFPLIFLTGLVVQSLFRVGPITMGAAVTVFLGDLVWHQVTGEWIFENETIPIAVFLGMTLLVTDPATSPRRSMGKLIYGILYGLAVFPLFLVLQAFGIPAFYDKLLQVPVLNLMLPWIERVADRIPVPAVFNRLAGGRLNAVHVAVWAGIFTFMLPSLMHHPGQDPAYWTPRCLAGNTRSCANLRVLMEARCDARPAEVCLEFGDQLASGKLFAIDEAGAVVAYGKACRAGVARGCAMLAIAQSEGRGGLSPDPAIAAALRRRACEAGDESSCVELASGLMDGRDVPRDPEAAVALLRGACDRGQASPCAVLGYIYSNGQGVAADPVAGRRYTQMACERGLQAACGAGGR